MSNNRAFKSVARLLLASAGQTTIVVLVIGWFTGCRQVMQSTFEILVTVAFLPFVIIALGLSLIAFALVFGPILAVLSEGGYDPAGAVDVGTGGIEEGVRMVPRYYRWLARQRHPFFWGTILGLILGTISLWVLVAWIIVPRELRTTEILLHTQAVIENNYKENGSYPEPDESGHLSERILSKDSTDMVRDGFGRPLIYTVSGKGLLSSYTIRSLGFNGISGGDDLCLEGATKLVKLAERLKSALTFYEKLKKGEKVAFKERIEAVRALRCKN